MLKPTKDRILAKVIDPEVSDSLIKLPDNAFMERPILCEVLDIGPKYVSPDIRIGSKVLIGKFDGADLQYAGESYKLLRPKEDILGVLA